VCTAYRSTSSCRTGYDKQHPDGNEIQYEFRGKAESMGSALQGGVGSVAFEARKRAIRKERGGGRARERRWQQPAIGLTNQKDVGGRTQALQCVETGSVARQQVSSLAGEYEIESTHADSLQDNNDKISSTTRVDGAHPGCLLFAVVLGDE